MTAADLILAAEDLRSALQRRDAALPALLKELVDIESHASQPGGVVAVGRVMERELVGAGCRVERVPGPALGPDQAWLADLMLPEGDYAAIPDVIVARRPGRGSRFGLLLGDLDTALAPGSPGRVPFSIDDGRAYGPGVADMKGGLVVLTAALRALAETGLDAPPLTVVLSPDEQAGSLRSRVVIEREAAGVAWCLCVECARDGGNLMGSRAHIGVARLDVYGRETHAGSAHGRGVSAIEELAYKVPAIQALTDPERGVYVTVGGIWGGRRRSVVPGHAYCTIDVRTPDAHVWAEVEAALLRIAESVRLPGASAQLRIYAHRPGIPWTAATDRLIAVAKRAGAAAGVSFGVVRSAAAGSSSFAGARGVPTLDGMGPVGGDLMTEREHVEVETLAQRALLLALTLRYLSNEEA